MKPILLLGILCLLAGSVTAQQKFFQRGLAELIPDGEKTGKNLGLHRTLPVGRKINVRNPANGRVITIQIVGKLPDTGANEKIILKISQVAYKQLNASGRRFSVELMNAPKILDLTHKVLKGETLYSISKRYKVSIDDVKAWNGLEDNTISEGQKLTIKRN